MERDEQNIVHFKCSGTEEDGACGKLYLRGKERTLVAGKVQKKSCYVYRAEEADNQMKVGDSEPPTLFKTSVLRMAKSELATSQYIDQDPVVALHKMQLFSMKDIIHSIGLSPFFVFSIFRTLVRPDKSKSAHLFVYLIVAQSSVGPVSVGQMISERQDTGAISFWLSDWVGNPGLPIPHEVVCDASKALLGAAVRSFTSFSTVSEYADALHGDGIPRCYIRIDVAHIIKKYADLFGLR